MKFNLNDIQNIDDNAKVGDVIAFYNPFNDDYDYFIIIKILGEVLPFGILRLVDGLLYDRTFKTIRELIEYAKEPLNDYYLYEIIPSNKLELRGINK